MPPRHNLEPVEDVSREGNTPEKRQHLFDLLRTRSATHALAKLDRFEQVNLNGLRLALGRRIQGVLLDVDECIAPHHQPILSHNVERVLNWAQGGTKVAIYSNSRDDSGRYDELTKYGQGNVKVVHTPFAKPDPRGFQDALDLIELGADDVIMIGDNFITDGGCIQIGIPFVHIEPISTPEDLDETSINRFVQVLARRLVIMKSNFDDVLTRRTVIGPSGMRHLERRTKL